MPIRLQYVSTSQFWLKLVSTLRFATSNRLTSMAMLAQPTFGAATQWKAFYLRQSSVAGGYAFVALDELAGRTWSDWVSTYGPVWRAMTDFAADRVNSGSDVRFLVPGLSDASRMTFLFKYVDCKDVPGDAFNNNCVRSALLFKNLSMGRADGECVVLLECVYIPVKVTWRLWGDPSDGLLKYQVYFVNRFDLCEMIPHLLAMPDMVLRDVIETAKLQFPSEYTYTFYDDYNSGVPMSNNYMRRKFENL